MCRDMDRRTHRCSTVLGGDPGWRSALLHSGHAMPGWLTPFRAAATHSMVKAYLRCPLAEREAAAQCRIGTNVFC
jgi:hypothetical protein